MFYARANLYPFVRSGRWCAFPQAFRRLSQPAQSWAHWPPFLLSHCGHSRGTLSVILWKWPSLHSPLLSAQGGLPCTSAGAPAFWTTWRIQHSTSRTRASLRLRCGSPCRCPPHRLPSTEALGDKDTERKRVNRNFWDDRFFTAILEGVNNIDKLNQLYHFTNYWKSASLCSCSKDPDDNFLCTIHQIMRPIYWLYGSLMKFYRGYWFPMFLYNSQLHCQLRANWVFDWLIWTLHCYQTLLFPDEFEELIPLHLTLLSETVISHC